MKARNSIHTTTTTTHNNNNNGTRQHSKGLLLVEKGGGEEEKYIKRRRQREAKHRRLWWVRIIVIGVLLLVTYLIYYYYVVPQKNSLVHQRSRNNNGKKKPSIRNVLKKAVNDAIPNQLLRHRDGSSIGGSQPDLMDDVACQKLLDDLNFAIQENYHSGIIWSNPNLLISLDTKNHPNPPHLMNQARKERPQSKYSHHGSFFRISRFQSTTKMKWELEEEQDEKEDSTSRREKDGKGPFVDYTQHQYIYPPLIMDPPPLLNEPDNDDVVYPKLQSMKQIMLDWPQDELDSPPTPLLETLLHFDYQNPIELEAARKFRDRKLPFKLYNIPELQDANTKWTDEYVSSHFDRSIGPYVNQEYHEIIHQEKQKSTTTIPRAQGTCQESATNFFAFFTPNLWNVPNMGLPPTRNNDWTFAKWAQHANYADKVGLDFDQPHFYWQAGVTKEEREMSIDSWTFISRDLPSLSSPKETFFVFHPEDQKGIQCRFGERGVTAATHFDAGRNMVAMITGAKRYILSPPRECSKLGIVAERGTAIFRHSLLNFGHFNVMDNSNMPQEEFNWLQRASTAEAISTVLKAGEVLYIPSHWFHYIISLQKSAQCNVRSGIDIEGDVQFGGQIDVQEHCLPPI